MQTAWCVFAKCTSKLCEFISFAGTGWYNPALLADGVMDGWIWFVSHLSQHWLDIAFDLLHCGIVIKSSVSWHSLLQKDGMVTFSVCLVRHNPTFSIRSDGFWILKVGSLTRNFVILVPRWGAGALYAAGAGLPHPFPKGSFSGFTNTQKWTANGSLNDHRDFPLPPTAPATKGVFPHHLASRPSPGSLSLLCNATQHPNMSFPCADPRGWGFSLHNCASPKLGVPMQVQDGSMHPS